MRELSLRDRIRRRAGNGLVIVGMFSGGYCLLFAAVTVFGLATGNWGQVDGGVFASLICFAVASFGIGYRLDPTGGSDEAGEFWPSGAFPSHGRAWMPWWARESRDPVEWWSLRPGVRMPSSDDVDPAVFLGWHVTDDGGLEARIAWLSEGSDEPSDERLVPMSEVVRPTRAEFAYADRPTAEGSDGRPA